MQVACAECGAKYEFEASAIPAGGYDAQCTHCGNVFFVAPEGGEEQISISCTKCKTVYRFPASAIPEGGYDAECTQCHAVFFVGVPGAKPKADAVPAADASKTAGATARKGELALVTPPPGPGPSPDPAKGQGASSVAETKPAAAPSETPAASPAASKPAAAPATPAPVGATPASSVAATIPAAAMPARPPVSAPSKPAATPASATASAGPSKPASAQPSAPSAASAPATPAAMPAGKSPAPPVSSVDATDVVPMMPAAMKPPPHLDATEPVPTVVVAAVRGGATPPPEIDLVDTGPLRLPKGHLAQPGDDEAGVDLLDRSAAKPPPPLEHHHRHKGPEPTLVGMSRYGDRDIPEPTLVGELPPDFRAGGGTLVTAAPPAAPRATYVPPAENPPPPRRQVKPAVIAGAAAVVVVLAAGAFVLRHSANGSRAQAVPPAAEAALSRARTLALADTAQGYAQALTEVESVRKLVPDSAEAAALGALVHVFRGLDARAGAERLRQAAARTATELDAADKEQPPDPARKQELERELAASETRAKETVETAERELDQASTLLATATKAHPESAALALASAFYQARDAAGVGPAEDLLLRSQQLRAGTPESDAWLDGFAAYLRALIAAQAAGDRAKVREALGVALASEPGLQRARYDLALELDAAGDHEGARRTLAELLGAVPDHARALATAATWEARQAPATVSNAPAAGDESGLKTKKRKAKRKK